MLYKVVGRRNISRFIADLARPHVVLSALEAGYAEMVADLQHEQEALAWSDSLIGDIN